MTPPLARCLNTLYRDEMRHEETREEWLQRAVSFFREGVFKHSGYLIPKIHVSISFPYGSKGTKRLGECWYPHSSDDKKFHIHISPIHGTSEAAMDTLIHELVHVIAGAEARHGPIFGAVARKIGLKGPMRTTPSMTPELKADIAILIKKLGPYPHGKLNPQEGRRKQGTRMYKMECRTCGYTVRAARKYILTAGPVRCPCNLEEMSYDQALEKEMNILLAEEEITTHPASAQI